MSAHRLSAAPVICIVGARPNYMKVAPIIRAFAAHQPPIPTLLVHTGQHYDPAMKDRLFADLDLPEPDVNLAVGSGSHAVQTAEVMKRFEPVIDEHGARAVLVVGDVNSTLACALVASKRHIPVVHVESGLRSNDRRMPEEINRILTDQISDVLYTTERSAHDNLVREGIPAQHLPRLTERFYERVKGDTLLAPVFAHMSSEHPAHVAAFLAEVLGGPTAYSERHGGHPHMIRQHLNRHLSQAQRRAWVALLLDTADELGMPDDPEFRSALVGYLEWGSRLAVINSQAGGQLYTSIAGLIYQNSAALPQFSEATMV